MQPLFIGRDIGSFAASDWETYIRGVAEQSDLFAVLDTHPGEFVKLHPQNEQVTQAEMQTLFRYYAPFLARQIALRWLAGESRFVVYEAIKRIVLSLPFGKEVYAKSICLVASKKLKHHKKKKRDRPERHPVVTHLDQLLKDKVPHEVLAEQVQWLLNKYGGAR